MRKVDPSRDYEIARLYASELYTTEHIAHSFKLGVRRVQQIAKARGVVRSVADANRVATPLKKRRRISISKSRIRLPE